MKTLSVTDVRPQLPTMSSSSVERQQEEIVLVRNQKEVARLVPEVPPQNARLRFRRSSLALSR